METSTPLLGLPTELRLIIYNYAVVQRVTGPRSDSDSGFTRNLIPPSLARVNRQLRKEVTHEYYSKNEFWIQIPTRKDHVHDDFVSQCEIAAEFLPLIRSLRCEACLTSRGNWSVVCFQTAPIDLASQGHNKGGEAINNKELDWSGYGNYRKFYRFTQRDMIQHWTQEQLWRYYVSLVVFHHENAAEVDHKVVSDALSYLLKHSVLGDGFLEAVFCRNWSCKTFERIAERHRV
ncbi:hypothetical protein F5Y10DRAFT_266011 [Nemania abortiva]|nr:hypothetical protein F5Y10DRAFT_266011 [Nemania abortiva]